MSVSKKITISDHAKEVEDFFGVYLLYNINPQYKGRTYIGKTTDPNRRISQHNRGCQFGGARRTSNKGPWDMVLIIHGFPNDVSALRFEWAWQHPSSSRRLKELPPKKSREKSFEYCLRLVASMLNLGPWNRLPLKVRWLKPEYKQEFALEPPLHMPIVFGPVKTTSMSQKAQKIKKLKKKTSGTSENEMEDLAEAEEDEELLCCICFKTVMSSKKLQCVSIKCSSVTHPICLSGFFLGDSENVIPVNGNCPTCGQETAWGDLVRKAKGCYEKELEVEAIQEEELDESVYSD